jgi:D-serine deaminase-like pyridoxal phosphate-dependent protein
VKTHKIPDIAKDQLEAGAEGITVAKLSQAEVMADAGFK